MHRYTIAVILGLTLSLSACTPGQKRAPILVAQSALAITQSIAEIRKAVSALEAAKALPTATALQITETLAAINKPLIKEVPDLLRAIDAAQAAGEATTGHVDKAIAVLQTLSPQIATLLAGVPIEPTTKALISLVQAAQASTTTVLLELARLKERAA